MVQAPLSLLCSTNTKLRPSQTVLMSKYVAARHVSAHDSSDRYTQVLLSPFLAAVYGHLCAAVAVGLDPSLPM